MRGINIIMDYSYPYKLCVAISPRDSRLCPPHVRQTMGNPQVAPHLTLFRPKLRSFMMQPRRMGHHPTHQECIEARLKPMQSSRERGNTSVEDKLKEDWVGARAITLEIEVSI